MASCIEYDIAQQPVSIHQPLWRFAAALFTAPSEIMSNYVCVDDSNEISLLSVTTEANDSSWENVTEVGKRNLNGLCPLLMEMPLRFAKCGCNLIINFLDALSSDLR